MKYSHEFDVNSHDEDIAGNIRASAIMRYMQECANLQLYTTGFAYDDLFRSGKVFLLSRINVSIYGKLRPHDKINVQTWLYDCHGVVFNRLYRIYKGDSLIAEGSSVWGLLGVEDRRIYRVTELDTSIHADDDTVDIDPPRRIFHKDVEYTLCGERTVYYADCDMNGHMNNTVYADMLFSFSPELKKNKNARIISMNISYLTEAKLGEELKVYTAYIDGMRCFRTVRSDGKINAEAEFIIE